MLVLSRQRDEVIMIGDDVEVRVVSIRGDRKEVYDKIKQEQAHE